MTEANTAKTMGSGTLDVFATPAMIALMELTAWKSVAPYLEEGNGTVGSYLDIHHNAPTPVGMTVTCESELIQVDGRKLTFRLTARDAAGVVGEGTHERFDRGQRKIFPEGRKKVRLKLRRDWMFQSRLRRRILHRRILFRVIGKTLSR